MYTLNNFEGQFITSQSGTDKWKRQPSYVVLFRCACIFSRESILEFLIDSEDRFRLAIDYSHISM